MIPLGDASRRPARFPIVTLGIIAACVWVFVLEVEHGQAFEMRWSAIPGHIAAGHDLVTLFTALFMHGSLLHILGNMVFLWAFGPEIEDAMGHLRYAIFYISGGILSMAVQVALAPDSTIPILGASGAIAAVMGAFIVTYPRDEIRTILVFVIFISITYVNAALLIGLWFVAQIFSAGSLAGMHSGDVAYGAHISGFVFGALFGRLFERSRH